MKEKSTYYLTPELVEIQMLEVGVLCQSAGINDMVVNDNIDENSFI